MPENTLLPGPHDMLSGPHDMMPQPNHDEAAHLRFARALRCLITSTLTPGHKTVYDARIVGQIEKDLGRPAQNRSEVKPYMEKDQYHQMWAAMLRTTQEMMWQAVYDCVERQADDVTPGAAYEQSVHVYMMGGMGQYSDDVGKMLSSYAEWKYPDFTPDSILDIGCSVGNSTLPYAEMFPDAEIHAIDLSAPLVRYGFARASSLGKAIHFSQQNAESTSFEDESFDLIVSHIMIHETSTKAIRNIMKEGRRLLKPGGVMVHLEMLPFSKKTPLQQYLTDWDSVNNHEPFIGKMNDLDMLGILEEAGFDEEERFVEFVPIGFNDPNQGSLDYASLIGTERHIFGARKKAAADVSLTQKAMVDA